MPWDTKDWITAYAAVLSTGVFAWTVGKEIVDRRKSKLERTKVFVSMHATHYRVPAQGQHVVVVLDVSNLGRESVIIAGAIAEGPGSKMIAGALREPDAAYGRRDRILPKKIEPGETAELPLFGPGIFRTPITKLYVTDSDEKQYEVTAETVERVKHQCESFAASRAEA